MLKFLSIVMAIGMMLTSSVMASDSTKINLNKQRKVKYVKLNINNNRIVALKGPVRYGNIQSLINKIKEMNEKNNKNIFMIINSPGGSVADGLELIGVMESVKSKIYCVIETEAYSMAAIISLFCHKTYIHKYATMMFHEANLSLDESYTKFFSRAEFLKRYLKMVDKSISKQMGVSTKSYRHMSLPEWWLTAREAARYGVVDGVLNKLNYYIRSKSKKNRNIFTFGYDERGVIVKNPLRTLDR